MQRKDVEITSISTEAYKEANTGCDLSDASKHAKSEEIAARKDATSLVRYRPNPLILDPSDEASQGRVP